MESVEARVGVEIARHAFDDHALGLDACFLLGRELVQPPLPEREVEVCVDRQSSLVVDNAKGAEIVDESRGADFSPDRVVEADIAVDVDALDRFEKIDDNDPDAGLFGPSKSG